MGDIELSMVSFQCEGCGDTLKKPKLDQHKRQCQWAQFTCIDCNTTFQGDQYRSHTSCISEAEKYQKGLYKGPKGGNKKQQQQQNGNAADSPSISVAASAPAAPVDVVAPVVAETSAAATLAAPSAEASTNGVSKKEKKDKKKKRKKDKPSDISRPHLLGNS